MLGRTRSTVYTACGRVVAVLALTVGAVACGNPEGDPLALPPVVLEISTNVLPDGRVGQTYATTLTAFGGQGGYTWSVIDGALPDGLSMSGAGLINGTPTRVESAAFMVQVVSANNQNATKQMTIDVLP